MELDRYIGVLSHTFYCNVCRDITYLPLYQGYRYIEDRCIGVPLYVKFFPQQLSTLSCFYLSSDQTVLPDISSSPLFFVNLTFSFTSLSYRLLVTVWILEPRTSFLITQQGFFFTAIPLVSMKDFH